MPLNYLITLFSAIDFGFSCAISANGLLETNCGSYVYSAPEVLDGEKYDGYAADVWSMGKNTD